MKSQYRCIYLAGLVIAVLVFSTSAVSAEDQVDELAKQLANPVAELMSLPFQFNYDANIGPEDDGERLTINIQPVIPFVLDDKWNLISRTIVPVIFQEDIFPGTGRQSGLGDTVQSLFFPPVPAPAV